MSEAAIHPLRCLVTFEIVEPRMGLALRCPARTQLTAPEQHWREAGAARSNGQSALLGKLQRSKSATHRRGELLPQPLFDHWLPRHQTAATVYVPQTADSPITDLPSVPVAVPSF